MSESKTPLTDAASYDVRVQDGYATLKEKRYPNGCHVPANFARGLERQIAALTRELSLIQGKMAREVRSREHAWTATEKAQGDVAALTVSLRKMASAAKDYAEWHGPSADWETEDYDKLSRAARIDMALNESVKEADAALAQSPAPEPPPKETDRERTIRSLEGSLGIFTAEKH